jgi:hypothetical protein
MNRDSLEERVLEWAKQENKKAEELDSLKQRVLQLEKVARAAKEFHAKYAQINCNESTELQQALQKVEGMMGVGK